MFVWDQSFKSERLTLVLLAGAQFVASLVGPVGALLIASGNEKILRDVSIIQSVVLIITLPILIHQFGVVGAALSAAVASIVSTFLYKHRASEVLGYTITISGGYKCREPL